MNKKISLFFGFLISCVSANASFLYETKTLLGYGAYHFSGITEVDKTPIEYWQGSSFCRSVGMNMASGSLAQLKSGKGVSWQNGTEEAVKGIVCINQDEFKFTLGATKEIDEKIFEISNPRLSYFVNVPIAVGSDPNQLCKKLGFASAYDKGSWIRQTSISTADYNQLNMSKGLFGVGYYLSKDWSDEPVPTIHVPLVSIDRGGQIDVADGEVINHQITNAYHTPPFFRPAIWARITCMQE